MFPQDKELIIAIITTSALILFLVVIIVTAIVKYQRNQWAHFHTLNKLKIEFQEETIKAQIEKEEQTLTRISQEIHDNIGQLLSLVKLNLNTLSIEACSDSVINKVVSTRDLVGKVIVDLRRLSQSLNSMHLSRGYLSELLKSELETINKTGIYTTNFSVEGEEKPFDSQKQVIIFRIAQEALNNIIKHAKAGRINIIMNYQINQLDLIIEDNGKGFHITSFQPSEINNSGTGVLNMYNRAKLIGGELVINSNKGEGTSVRLSVPYD